ncbi:MAG: UbiA family prenyltransferase [archaeon]|nr:MAG: UbiA family prenyltransferase [archaeon]
MVKCFVELLRPINGIMAAIAVFIGALIAGGTFVAYMTEVHIAIIATFFITGAGMTINDFCDREIDFVNKRNRPIPSGRVRPKGALMISMTLFAIGIYISYYINVYCLVIALISSAFLVIYSYRLKKMLVFGHLIISYLVASSFLFGGLAVNLGNLVPVATFSLIAFFANFSREIVKTIEDMKGDKMGKVKSLPILFGESRARKISSLLTAITIILAPVPYVLGYMSNTYMYVVSVGLILFLFSIIWNIRNTPAENVQKLMKVAMTVCLLAFLAGALF